MNVWALPDNSIGLLLSHVDSLDENWNLAKLGRIMVRVVPQVATSTFTGTMPTSHPNYTMHQGMIGSQPPMSGAEFHCPGITGTDRAQCPVLAAAACDSTPECVGFSLSPAWSNGTVAQFHSMPLAQAEQNQWWTLWQRSGSRPGPPPAHTQPFRMSYHLSNMSVRIQLPVVQNVTVDVFVDANTDAVRVASTGDQPHRLEATLEVWRNTTGRAPTGSWCASLHPNVTLHADTILPRANGIMFYHRTLEEWPSMWAADLASQQMPADLPNPLINTTFGGFLTGGAHTGPMQMTSSSDATAQTLSIAGVAGVRVLFGAVILFTM